jgi:hypothetical protein
MREFEIALHHNVTVLRKKRLIVLMKLPNPPITYRPAQKNDSKIETDSLIVTYSLRQYLRQYTYVDCSADDWFTRFLYTLPINGMLKENRNNNDEERKPLMHERQSNFKG